MKSWVWIVPLAALVLSSGCKRAPQVEPGSFPARKPVVDVAPVPTRPYEEGYDAGFELARQKATARSKMPDPEDVQRLAGEQATDHPERNERWTRGFVAGYTDGFRNVVTGQK